uniref:U3 small nucleolar RNA-associated protein 14 A n=1 Tax=Aceria tosichella TaxID=561515 RepID=A0A6G1SHB4_9ACAR
MSEEPEKKSRKTEGQVTLTQMLKALDKDVAVGIEKKLKRLSKKKAVEKPLDDLKAAQIERIDAYSTTTKEISKWDPIVERNRSAKNLTFPLDTEPEHLPTSAECIDAIKPRNDLEREVQSVIDQEKAAKMKETELSKAEERYQKAISAEEAKERHKELQRMRVKLNSFGAKMRRQKGIKSKSYHRLLKHERIRKHVKKVESNQDALLNEIERLQKLRAQERASLKHKNTGKWAKHAKFRAKYDDEARQAMLEQIGIASKLLEKPAMPESDEEDFGDNNNTSDDEDEDEISETSEQSECEDDDEAVKNDSNDKSEKSKNESDRLIVSTELIDDRLKAAMKKSDNNDDIVDSGGEDDDGDDDDEQRKLMSEAFANDDVVSQFKEAKDKVADEEQPKDINTFLPGWGDWAGPGIKINKRKSKRFIIKAKKIKRKDATLGNVIISEKANDVIKELQPKALPRGFRNDEHLKKVITAPTTATFLDQTAHRDKIRPQIETQMGKRIEPIGQHMLSGAARAEWA